MIASTFDWKSFLDRYIDPEISGITASLHHTKKKTGEVNEDKQMEPHWIRIFKNAQGVVVFQYKSLYDLKHSRDWQGNGADGIPIFLHTPPELSSATWPADYGFHDDYMRPATEETQGGKGTSLPGELKSVLSNVKKFTDGDRSEWDVIFDHAWPENRGAWGRLVRDLRAGTSPVQHVFTTPPRELPPRQPPRSDAEGADRTSNSTGPAPIEVRLSTVGHEHTMTERWLVD